MVMSEVVLIKTSMAVKPSRCIFAGSLRYAPSGFQGKELFMISTVSDSDSVIHRFACGRRQSTR